MRQKDAEKKAAAEFGFDVELMTDHYFSQIIFEQTELTKTRNHILLNPRNKCLFI